MLGQPAPQYICPVMTNRPTSKRFAVDYVNSRYYVCCDQCIRTFSRRPEGFIKQAASANRLIGDVIFDPITHVRVQPEKALSKQRKDHVIWHFSQEQNAIKFLAEVAVYSAYPNKECLTCASCDVKMKTLGDAFGYVDYSGVRYFLHSQECFDKLNANPRQVETNRNLAPESIKGHIVPIPGIDF